MEEKRRNRTILAAVVSVILLAGILVGRMFLLTGSAHKDASEAAKSVSHCTWMNWQAAGSRWLRII